MISKYYGSNHPLHELRDLCGITRDGVSLAGIRHCAEQIGFRTISARCNVEDLTDKIPLPAILHWGGDHFVVLYKVSKGSRLTFRREKEYIFDIADPAHGKIAVKIDELRSNWIKDGSPGKGVVLVLEPGNRFQEEATNEHRDAKTSRVFLRRYFLPYKKSLVYISIIMLLLVILQGSLPFISRAIIDIGIFSTDNQFVQVALIANFVLVLSIALGNGLRDWILLHIAVRLHITMVADYLTKLMKLPVNFFETKLTGDILQRAGDHERIRSFMMNNVLNMLFSSLTFIIFSVILLIFNRWVFFVFLTGSLVYLSWILFFLETKKQLDWKYFKLSADNQSCWIEIIESIAEIKGNNYELKKGGNGRRFRQKCIK